MCRQPTSSDSTSSRGHSKGEHLEKGRCYRGIARYCAVGKEKPMDTETGCVCAITTEVCAVDTIDLPMEGGYTCLSSTGTGQAGLPAYQDRTMAL